jgi:hypothetical protein
VSVLVSGDIGIYQIEGVVRLLRAQDGWVFLSADVRWSNPVWVQSMVFLDDEILSLERSQEHLRWVRGNGSGLFGFAGREFRAISGTREYRSGRRQQRFAARPSDERGKK